MIEIKYIIYNLLLLIVSITTFISYLPQIVKLIKTKKSEDISVMSWILWVLGSGCYSISTFINGDTMLIIAGLTELLLEGTVLVLTLRYKA